MTKHTPSGGICPNWITWKDLNTSQQQLLYMNFNMKAPTLKNSTDEFKSIFKSWNEVSQKLSTKYGKNSLGEMAFWYDESWSLYLHGYRVNSAHTKLGPWQTRPIQTRHIANSAYSKLSLQQTRPMYILSS